MTIVQFDIAEDLWDRIKGTVPSNKDLKNEIPRRIALASFGERFERKADGRGRVSLPKDYADEHVVVLVVDEDELDEVTDDGE